MATIFPILALGLACAWSSQRMSPGVARARSSITALQFAGVFNTLDSKEAKALS